MSRTKKSLKNIIYSMVSTLITMVLQFIIRTVFIKNLGAQYLGLNGLMTNIISMLSLAELGIGTALIFKLYQPLSNDNKQRVNQLMTFYKSAYQIVSLIILLGGILIIPFLKIIIKGDISFVNIYAVFFAFLFQAISSYLFFAYKSSLLIADQKEYVITELGLVVDVISSLIQLLVLVKFESYMLFLCVLIAGNITKNILIGIRVDREYGYVKYKSDSNLPKEELRSLFNDFKALFIYKINNIVVKSTDNIIISSFIGLITVGLYSNYLLITNSLFKIINPIFQSIKSSIGNLYAEKGEGETYRLFKIVNLLTVFFYGGASIGVFILSNKFITIWLGSDYVLSTLFSVLISVEFYIRGLQLFLGHFRNALGLFQQAKYRPIFSAIINLVLSLILIKPLGINGVIIGTIVSSLLTYMWYDPLIIHKYGFGIDATRFYLINSYYVMVLVVIGFSTYYISNLIFTGSLISLISIAITTAFLILIIFLLTLGFLKETKDLFGYFKIFKK